MSSTVIRYRKLIWLLIILALILLCGGGLYWFFGTEVGQVVLAIGVIAVVWQCAPAILIIFGILGLIFSVQILEFFERLGRRLKRRKK
jgi:hypothetical protein